MEIGIIGSGTMAEALGAGWIAAGHTLLIGGRSPERTAALADRLGPAARAVTPREAAEGGEAVLLAVRWEDVEEALHAAGAADGALAGRALIDCTNAVEHGVGALLTAPGEAAAQRIARLAPGARVVKAFHLFPAAQWQPGGGAADAVTVPLAGDAGALEVVARLVRDVGGRPHAVGGLERARQLEEVAGFVIALAFGGADPAAAVPHVPVPAATNAA